MRRGPSIRYLLLSANAFILLLPIFAILFLRLWDTHLVRITEERLISESVLIAEAHRAELLRELGRSSEGTDGPDRIAPAEATLDLSYDLAPPGPPATRTAGVRDGPEWRAGARLKPWLDRAKRENLSGARLLDAAGCIVATTGEDFGICLDELPEVREALSGRYAAVARRRAFFGEPPRLGGISRRGLIRVFIALPILIDGKVAGVVRLSRTSSSPMEAVWVHLRTVLIALCGCGITVGAVTIFLSRVISRPVEQITHAAEAIASGAPPQPFTAKGLIPSEIQTLGGALDLMTAQLTDRAKYVAGFATNVSHELKTPIAAIRGAVELLREDWESMPEAQRQRFLGNIDADAERMERLVTRLLLLARIQNVPEATESVDVVPFFLQLTERYGSQVALDIDRAPRTLTINPDHLETAVHNLIDNGIRHGAGKPVEVSVGERNSCVVVRVRDHGAGISEGNRPHIFERFFTTERDRGGTGLGLAIVKAVAETRGGSVEFDTGPEGTTFTLTL